MFWTLAIEFQSWYTNGAVAALAGVITALLIGFRSRVPAITILIFLTALGVSLLAAMCLNRFVERPARDLAARISWRSVA